MNRGCEQCELLPRGLPEDAVLYYSAARDATEDRIARACSEAGLDEVSDNPLEVRAFTGTGDKIRGLCRVVTREVTSVEQDTTRVLLVQRDRAGDGSRGFKYHFYQFQSNRYILARKLPRNYA